MEKYLSEYRLSHTGVIFGNISLFLFFLGVAAISGTVLFFIGYGIYIILLFGLLIFTLGFILIYIPPSDYFALFSLDDGIQDFFVNLVRLSPYFLICAVALSVISLIFLIFGKFRRGSYFRIPLSVITTIMGIALGIAVRGMFV